MKEPKQICVGDIVKGEVIAEGKGGDGIIKHESGIVIFIRNSKKGDTVIAKVVSVSAKHAIAIPNGEYDD